jgi:SagB-type dehydrogenase family enzyme
VGGISQKTRAAHTPKHANRGAAGRSSRKRSSLPLIKRSECLVFYFRNGKIHCKNYLTGVEVASAPIIVNILNSLEHWRPGDLIERLLSEYSPVSIRRTLKQLRGHTLVLRKGSPQAEQEALLLKTWRTWGEEARFFHFATKYAFRWGLPSKKQIYTREFLRAHPQPAQFKQYHYVDQLSLPDHTRNSESEFERVLLARRTHRRFGPGSISLEQLSALLDLTWGVKAHLQWPGLGRLPLKTSPSGGARHPLEVYVFALRVKGLHRGIYHYRADRNSLELLSRSATERRLVKLCAGQDWIHRCSALFVMTAVLPRVMWRYDFSRAYRVVLLEAGHFCQTFCLVATWLGLGPFCTAALVDTAMERELAVDGASETVLYAAGVGPKISNDRSN